MKTKPELKNMSENELIALLMSVSHETSSLYSERDVIVLERDTYKTERNDYKEKLDRDFAERDRLRAIVLKLQRHQFGRRSERLSSDQLQLALEDLAQTLAAIDAKEEAEHRPSGEDKGSPIAEEALRRYAQLYAIEGRIRGCLADVRLAVRQEHIRPLMEDFHVWLKEQLERISGGSELAKKIRYCLARWTDLCRFLSDGRLEMDQSTVERAIRPQKLTVRNALFAGSDGGAEHWAQIATIVETCRLCGVEPFAYLKDVLTRITNGHPINRIAELTPWAYMPTAVVIADVTDHGDTPMPENLRSIISAA